MLKSEKRQPPLGGSAERLNREARQRRLEETGGSGVVQQGDVTLIPLLNGRFAKVDTEDVRLVARYWWRWNRNGYAATNFKQLPSRYMHRLLIKCPIGMEVDHVNQDKLDNRKSNLRICSRAQNLGNRWKPKHGKTSKFKGVSFCKRDARFIAHGKEFGKTKHLGSFPDQETAAAAYNKWALSYFGEFAMLNEL